MYITVESCTPMLGAAITIRRADPRPSPHYLVHFPAQQRLLVL